MRFIPLILSAICATTLQAQSLFEERQFDLGPLLPTDSISFKIEYPQYTRLSKQQVELLKKQGFIPKSSVEFNINRTISRGRTIVDVSYVPVVKCDGKWFTLSSYDLKPVVGGTKVSAAMRVAYKVADATVKANRYAEHSVLSKGKWVKISVTKEGIYQLTDTQLRDAGFSDPSKVRLYGYGGRLINEKFTFEGSDALIDDLCEVPLYRRSGSVLFFAEGLQRWVSDTKFKTNTYANSSCYFLTEATSGEAPAQLLTQTANNGSATAVNTVVAHALLDNDKTVWYGGGRNFYDDNDLQGGHRFKLSLPGNSGNSSTVAYDISSNCSLGTTSVVIRDASNGQTLTSQRIGPLGDEESARGVRGTMKGTYGNELDLNISTTSKGYLNYLYATYDQTLSTAYTTSAFTTKSSGAVKLSVAQANVNTRVLQIADAEEQATLLPGSLNGSTYEATANDGSKRFVLFDISKTYESPTIVGSIENQDLHADSNIDYVIVIPTSGQLQEQADRLAEAHRNKGLRVKVVRANQLYNEFSSGTPDASAYRRYMKMLYDKATDDSNRPSHLLLFGNCAYDNRMITDMWKKSNPNDYLLAYESSDQEKETYYKIGTLTDYVSDDYYGLLDDGEGNTIASEKIDLGIGRLPCQNADQAKIVVDNTIRYINNEVPGVWKNKMWAIADYGNNNLHMNDAESVCSQVANVASDGFMVRRIYPDLYDAVTEAKGTTYPTATSKIKQSMQQGALIFNYNGHGDPSRLSHSFILAKEDVANNVSSALPLWIFASCEITPYDQAISDFGREALMNEKGGAIGVICASRTVYSTYNCALNKGVVKYAFSKADNGTGRITLGGAMRMAKAELITTRGNTIGYDPTINKLKYNLLGDPAVILNYVDEGVFIDSINGKSVAKESTLVTPLAVGDKVSFAGYINADTEAQSADNTFNGTVYATLYAPKQTLTCKGFGSDTKKVYSDYTQVLFDGKASVKNGRFVIETIIPRGITLSQSAPLLSLYAVENDNKRELNGAFSKFNISKVSPSSENVDSIGPKVFMYFDNANFPDGGTIGHGAVLYATISDSTAISMMSGSMGHDMELWFDNNAAESVNVNNYFSFKEDSYNEGVLEYDMSNLKLSNGRHKATLRVWDVNDNVTTTSLNFNIKDEGTPDFDVDTTISTPTTTTRFITTFGGIVDVSNATSITTEVYDINGRRVWHKQTEAAAGNLYAAFDWDLTNYAGAKLERGVYLYRSIVNNKKTKTKKLIIR